MDWLRVRNQLLTNPWWIHGLFFLGFLHLGFFFLLNHWVLLSLFGLLDFLLDELGITNRYCGLRLALPSLILASEHGSAPISPLLFFTFPILFSLYVFIGWLGNGLILSWEMPHHVIVGVLLHCGHLRYGGDVTVLWGVLNLHRILDLGLDQFSSWNFGGQVTSISIHGFISSSSLDWWVVRPVNRNLRLSFFLVVGI